MRFTFWRSMKRRSFAFSPPTVSKARFSISEVLSGTSECSPNGFQRASFARRELWGCRWRCRFIHRAIRSQKVRSDLRRPTRCCSGRRIGAFAVSFRSALGGAAEQHFRWAARRRALRPAHKICGIVVASVLASAAATRGDDKPAPEGCHWQDLPEIKAHIAVPNGWIFRQVEAKEFLAFEVVPAGRDGPIHRSLVIALKTACTPTPRQLSDERVSLSRTRCTRQPPRSHSTSRR